MDYLHTGDSEADCEQLRGRMRLRRSDISNIERAKSRTLRMTITIVCAFIWCWTPYVVMTLWYMFDRKSAEKVDSRLQEVLFIMAVSNSCMNPLVYGSYAMNFRRECSACFCCPTPAQTPLHRKSTGGSGATRSTGVAGAAGFGGICHSNRSTHLTIHRRPLRPVSAEQLMSRSGGGTTAGGGGPDSEEFHSDPGAGTGVYLVVS